MRHYVEDAARLVGDTVRKGIEVVGSGDEFTIGLLIDQSVSEMIAGRIMVECSIAGPVEAVVEASRIVIYRVQV